MTRIIAGSHRGRRLNVPPGESTRPTADRVREALFSALTAWAGRSSVASEEALRGFAFLDLYAGSGAVGLEAASRGAGPVLLVESDRRTAELAARNARTLDLAARVTTARVERWASRPADRPYDIAFADPPYALPTETVSEVVAAVIASGWLAGDALVAVERSRRASPLTWPAELGNRWQRTYGETVLQFGER